MGNSTNYIWFYDFHYVWGAAHVFSTGSNPYDFNKYEAAVQSTYWPASEGIAPFPQPPLNLLVYLPFGSVNFYLGLSLWLICLVVCAYYSFLLLTKISANFSNTPTYKIAFGLLLFPPTYSTFLNAQYNFFVLLGCLLLIYNWNTSRQSSIFGLLLTLLKPHIVIPIYLWVAIRSLCERRTRELLAPTLLVIILCWLAEFISPGIWHDYLSILPTTGPLHTTLPGATVSQIVFASTGFSKTWLLMLSISIVLATYLGIKDYSVKDCMLILLPISALSAPYIWGHTFLFLAYPYCLMLTAIAEKGERKYQAYIFVIAALGIFEYIRPHEYSWVLVWLPIALLMLGIKNLRLNRTVLAK